MEKAGTEGYLHTSGSYQKFIFIATAACCLTPFVSPPVALLLGLLVAQLTGHPYPQLNHRFTQILLQASVVGLGFGMDLLAAFRAGKEGVWLTVGSITLTLLAGWLLGKIFRINRPVSFLISAGTAICGGSAIAALSPVIRAEEKQVSVSLAIIFILNSAALFLFPAVGHWLQLSSTQFGLWCAIAIHDTRSVVGAASRFDPVALEVATTVKLARALWIIPVAIGASAVFSNGHKKIRIPWFIGLFILAMVLSTYISWLHEAGAFMHELAKAGLTLTLFLIGSGLSAAAIKGVGFRPFAQGVLLWIFISVVSLLVIMNNAG
jgi:uncharacterized integral membrane protein (TIGR00698 family)